MNNALTELEALNTELAAVSATLATLTHDYAPTNSRRQLLMHVGDIALIPVMIAANESYPFVVHSGSQYFYDATKDDVISRLTAQRSALTEKVTALKQLLFLPPYFDEAERCKADADTPVTQDSLPQRITLRTEDLAIVEHDSSAPRPTRDTGPRRVSKFALQAMKKQFGQ